jgi:UPF0716 family protein affecting phage T7 exclusion
MDASFRKRFLRAGTILLLGWLVLEIALLRLMADRFGWALALLSMTLKGGLGLALLFALTLRGLSRLRGYIEGRSTLDAALGTAFGVASAVLIALPGFVPTLVGLALFLPAVRTRCVAYYATASDTADPGTLDLGACDWAETHEPGAAPPVREVSAAGEAQVDRAPSLERKPPSV